MTHPLAGKPAPPDVLVDVRSCGGCTSEERPRPRRTRSSGSPSAPAATAGRRSGARSTRRTSWPMTQAVCEYRKAQGDDRAALPGQGHARALRPGAGDGAGGARAPTTCTCSGPGRPTPTPVISHAILTRTTAGCRRGFADGIVITPSHNPPEDGGIRYNPPNGGRRTPPRPAGSSSAPTSCCARRGGDRARA